MADLLDNNLRSEMLTTKSAIETIATEVLGLELFNQSESSTQEVGNDDENSAVCGWCYFFLVSVILCTMYGNLMVCLAVMFDKRLQNIINYFLVSLAMTDMAVAILVMPFAIVLAYNNGKQFSNLNAFFTRYKEMIIQFCKLIVSYVSFGRWRPLTYMNKKRMFNVPF